VKLYDKALYSERPASCAPRPPSITPMTSAFIGARRGTAQGLAPASERAGALPTYTAEPSSPTKLQPGIWTLSLPSTDTTTFLDQPASSDWNNHGNGRGLGCVPPPSVSRRPSTPLRKSNHGEFAIHGFRNRDLRAIFFPQTTDDKQQRRRHSAWIKPQTSSAAGSRPDHQNRGHTPLPANLRRFAG